MERINHFIEMYKECNQGTNQEKYQLIKQGQLTMPRYLDVEMTNL